MPRRKPPEGVPASTEELGAKVTELTDKLDRLADVVGSLAERVLEEKKEEIPETTTRPNSASGYDRVPIPEPLSIEGMIPKAWREKVDAILGADFKVELVESSGGNYIMRVYIPKQYDRRVGEERTMMSHDVSTGVIRRATDLADVEKWCGLIKQNIQKMYPNFQPVKPL